MGPTLERYGTTWDRTGARGAGGWHYALRVALTGSSGNGLNADKLGLFIQLEFSIYPWPSQAEKPAPV